MSKYPTTESDDSRPSHSRSEIENQAATWVLRITGHVGLGDAAANEFLLWLRAHPRHAAEYRAQMDIAQLAPDLHASTKIRIQARNRHHTTVDRLFPFSRLGLAIGALVLVLASVAAAVWTYTHTGRPSPANYTTGTAETRSIHLDDGSVVELNTRTSVQWYPTENDRQLSLLEGEVYVDAAPDPQRPFSVFVGRSEIRVIGTRFDVYKKNPDTVVLTVVAGTVEVSACEAGHFIATCIKRISAPRKIEYRMNGAMQEKADPGAALQWRDGVVQFRDESLAEAVEELRRYTDRRVVLDQRLANAQVGGVYSTRDVTADFTRMAQSLPMAVHDNGSVISLSFREQESSRAR